MKRKLLPAMLAKAQEFAALRMAEIVAAARADVQTQLCAERERLAALAAINDHVRPAELAAITRQQAELEQALAGARLRLDALRLILRLA